MISATWKILNLTIFILGDLILGLTLHSHLTASWLTGDKFQQDFVDNREIEIEMRLSSKYPVMMPSAFCEIHNSLVRFGLTRSYGDDMLRCPSIATEKFFVAVTIVNFGASLFRLVLFCFGRDRVGQFYWQVFEFGYHGILSVFLFAGGIVYIQSATQIETLTKWMNQEDEFRSNLRTQEKIASGALAIVQALLCVIIIFFVGYRLRMQKSPASTTISLQTIG